MLIIHAHGVERGMEKGCSHMRCAELRAALRCAELSMNIYDSIWRMKKTVILLAAAGCCELETSSAMENVAVFGYNLSSTQ